MNQEERLDYLIDAFKKDSVQYKEMSVAKQERKRILRSLRNVRMPKPISSNVQTIQDEYLKEEAVEKGIVKLDQIKTVKEELGSTSPFADKISIWQGDITRLAAGAIVNAANSQMLGCFIPCHRCIDNAIHSAAGIELREACNAYMHERRKAIPGYEEPTGHGVVTLAFNLPCDYVIHTVGPIVGWKLTEGLKQDLRNCYQSCLQAAVQHSIKSIAFCCISTGEFHFPNEDAAEIAVETVTEFLKRNPDTFDRIIFNVFKDQDLRIYRMLFS